MQHEKVLRNTAEKDIKQQISNVYNALREMKGNHETICVYWPEEQKWLSSPKPAPIILRIRQYKKHRARMEVTWTPAYDLSLTPHQCGSFLLTSASSSRE